MRGLARAWAAAARRALQWQGPDGAGPRLQTWLLILAGLLVMARLLERLEPAVMLVPPFVALAIAIPALFALGDWLKNGVVTARTLRALEMTAVMVFFAAWTWSTWRHVLRGTVPIDAGDHQFMMGRAEITWDGLRRGKWLHWTHLWQGGDSIVDLYPIEANLLTALFHALSPRGTRFVTSYSVFVIWTWWLRGVAVYYLLRRFSGPVVALLLACASLYEVGEGVWDGIWSATIYWGMVHNSLALTFGVFATALMVDLVRRVSGPRFVACALLVALTACGHALGMLLVAVQTAALALALLVGKGSRSSGVWALAACVSGLMLAGAWILPFSHALAVWGYRVAVPGLEYSDLGTGLFNGHAPSGNFITFVGFGIVAITAAVVSNDVALAATAICTVLLVILSLTPLMVQAGLLDLVPSLLDGQPRRMLTVMKTTSLPALGWLLSLSFSHLRRASSLAWPKVAARAMLLALLLYGPGRTLAAGWEAIGAYLVEQAPDRRSPDRRTYTNPDYDNVVGWLKKARAQDPSSTPWRAMIRFKDQKRHPFWAEGIDIGVPFVDQDQISSNFLTFRPREFSADGMRDWNIRFVVTDRPEAPLPELVERLESGSLHLFELPDYDDRYIVAPEAVSVTGIRLVDDEIRFDVAGAPPEGADLQIRTAWFPRWRARLAGGGALALTSRLPRPSAKPRQDQIVVRARNGSIVVSCDGFMPWFWQGLGVSILGAAGVVLLAAERRREKLEAWFVAAWRALTGRLLEGWRRRVRHKPRVVAGLVFLLVPLAVTAAARGGSHLSLPMIEGLGGVDVYAGPGSASAPSQKCAAEWWRGRYHCGGEGADVDSWLGSVAPGDSTGESGKLWPGTRVSIPRAGSKVRLHYARLQLRGNALRMRISARGTLSVMGFVDSRLAFDRVYRGEAYEDITLPGWVPYAAGLDLVVTATDPNSVLVFRGDLVSR
jgi:hypothetical protein